MAQGFHWHNRLYGLRAAKNKTINSTVQNTHVLTVSTCVHLSLTVTILVSATQQASPSIKYQPSLTSVPTIPYQTDATGLCLIWLGV